MTRRQQRSDRSSIPAGGAAGKAAAAAIAAPAMRRQGTPARTEAAPANAEIAPPALAAPYLDDPRRIGLTFGAFFLLCLPLAASFFFTNPNASPVEWLVIFQAYSILVGYTHFAITFSIYLNSRNLEYFRSSPKNILIYFIAPVLILGTWFFLGYLGINEARRDSSSGFLLYLFWFALLTKLADYLHVVRQSFGVLQLFKRQAGMAFPQWVRRTENAFFITLMVLQVLTYSEGLKANNIGAARFNMGNPWSVAGLVIGAGLFVAILYGYASMARSLGTRRRSLLVPFSYFLLQTASASLPVYWSVLYLASLAMHYVEYHVVMYPRVFRSSLRPDSRVDRLAQWLRSHRMVFYGLLAGFCYLFMGNGLGHIGKAAGADRQVTWLLLNLFNGIFLTHFFIEAFVWKFHLPFYRQTLGPLYFPAAKPST